MHRLTVHQRGSFLKDIVFSASDGIITTFAIVAGSVGASFSPSIILILGFANLFADGISMAAGNYLGSKTEVEYEKAKGNKSAESPPFYHALVTFIAFCIAGLVPLVPYLFRLEPVLPISILFVVLAQFTVGSMRSILTKRNFFLGGIEMLVIGGFAASVAYIVGYLLSLLVG